MHHKFSISTLISVNAHQALYHQISAISRCTGLRLRVLGPFSAALASAKEPRVAPCHDIS